MASWFEVVESKHDLQNPTSEDKILWLGERLELGASSEVLDMGSGSGGPAVLLAESFGCRVTCVEISEAFVLAADERRKQAGVEELVDLVVSDGGSFAIEPERYDSALCLGATFIWDGLEPTIAALASGVRDGGFLAVGEPYWRTWPLPTSYEPEEGYAFRNLIDTVAAFESGGMTLVSLVAANRDDWDRYVSLQWLALEEWLHDHPGHPDGPRFREMGRKERARYLKWERDLLGWAVFVGRKRNP